MDSDCDPYRPRIQLHFRFRDAFSFSGHSTLDTSLLGRAFFSPMIAWDEDRSPPVPIESWSTI